MDPTHRESLLSTTAATSPSSTTNPLRRSLSADSKTMQQLRMLSLVGENGDGAYDGSNIGKITTGSSSSSSSNSVSKTSTTSSTTTTTTTTTTSSSITSSSSSTTAASLRGGMMLGSIGDISVSASSSSSDSFSDSSSCASFSDDGPEEVEKGNTGLLLGVDRRHTIRQHSSSRHRRNRRRRHRRFVENRKFVAGGGDGGGGEDGRAREEEEEEEEEEEGGGAREEKAVAAAAAAAAAAPTITVAQDLVASNRLSSSAPDTNGLRMLAETGTASAASFSGPTTTTNPTALTSTAIAAAAATFAARSGSKIDPSATTASTVASSGITTSASTIATRKEPSHDACSTSATAATALQEAAASAAAVLRRREVATRSFFEGRYGRGWGSLTDVSRATEPETAVAREGKDTSSATSFAALTSNVHDKNYAPDGISTSKYATAASSAISAAAAVTTVTHTTSFASKPTTSTTDRSDDSGTAATATAAAAPAAAEATTSTTNTVVTSGGGGSGSSIHGSTVMATTGNVRRDQTTALPPPRSLYVAPKSSLKVLRPRWPIELELMYPGPKHHITSPPEVFPYQKSAPRPHRAPTPSPPTSPETSAKLAAAAKTTPTTTTATTSSPASVAVSAPQADDTAAAVYYTGGPNTGGAAIIPGVPTPDAPRVVFRCERESAVREYIISGRATAADAPASTSVQSATNINSSSLSSSSPSTTTISTAATNSNTSAAAAAVAAAPPPPPLQPYYAPAASTALRYSVFRSCERSGISLAPNYGQPNPKFSSSSSSFSSSSAAATASAAAKAARDPYRNNFLVFESRFESGNLLMAEAIGLHAYNLTLRRDLRTVRHTQWFYFRVTNTRAGQTYKFNIVNLLKSDSLYNHGMQPTVYSESQYREKNRGWHRAGAGMRYYRNGKHTYSSRGRRMNHHTLHWTYTATHDNDTVYFAHCYPYTYSDLEAYLLHHAKSNPDHESICRKRTLCKTLAGNACYLLTITNFRGATREAMAARRGVVITSRVHPGESVASWMMKGVLDHLLSDSPDAMALRDAFVFKIVPMMNPDGVIVGNYRCNLAGSDLNRTHRHPSRNLHPTVFHSKELIRQLRAERPVVMYCDLHGHSRAHGVFIYGCDNRDDRKLRLRERVFPKMLGLNAPGLFNFRKCKFRVQKSKYSTGRVVGWREHDILNSFTMEATFAGCNFGRGPNVQFTPQDYERVGHAFCDTLLDYCDPDQSKAEYLLLQIRAKVRARLVSRLGWQAPADLDIDRYDYESDLESTTAGSDSAAPSEDEKPAEVAAETAAAVPVDVGDNAAAVAAATGAATTTAVSSDGGAGGGGKTKKRRKKKNKRGETGGGSSDKERSRSATGKRRIKLCDMERKKEEIALAAATATLTLTGSDSADVRPRSASDPMPRRLVKKQQRLLNRRPVLTHPSAARLATNAAAAAAAAGAAAKITQSDGSGSDSNIGASGGGHGGGISSNGRFPTVSTDAPMSPLAPKRTTLSTVSLGAGLMMGLPPAPSVHNRRGGLGGGPRRGGMNKRF